jgi:hypothetical protein
MKIARLIGACTAITLLVTLVRPLVAQNDTLPAEVSALFDDIADIRTLDVLRPLSLTKDQAERLADAIVAAQKDYNSKLVAAAVPPIRDIAKEIKETRAKVLSGSAVPSDFRDKVKDIEDAYLQKRSKQDNDTLSKLAGSTKAILNSSQAKAAGAQAKKDLESNKRDVSKWSEDQLYNYYVLRIFIQYPRIVPLLRDVAKAKGGG